MKKIYKYQKIPPITRKKFECFIQPQLIKMINTSAKYKKISLEKWVELAFINKLTQTHHSSHITLCKKCGRITFTKTGICVYCGKNFSYGSGSISKRNNRKRKK